jgi:hypothetical protein
MSVVTNSMTLSCDKLQLEKQMRRLALVFGLIGCESKEAMPPASSNTPSVSSSSPAAPSSQPAATSGGRQTPSCGPEIITDEGIGELRIRTTVESVRQRCSVVRDTTAPGAEGMPARKLRVALSRDTVEAEIVDGRVWRIAVHAPRLRTADSLGVGTTLARLLQLRNPRGMTGEGRFYVASPDHCGMSFRLANAGPRAQRGDLDNAGLMRLPRSAVVSEVLIFGCRSQTSGG